VTDEICSAIVKKHKKGASIRAIAADVKLSKATVHKVVVAAG
jgi:transposase